jgi:hypothetical protein
MKKCLLFSFVLAFLFVLVSCSDNTDEKKSTKESTTDFSKRYGIKSGVIEYTLSGSQEGTKTLYFDNWGMRQAEHTISILSVGGFTKNVNLLNIIDGEFQYIINVDVNSGTKKRNPILKEIEELKFEKSYGEFGEQILLKTGAVKIGVDKFLNKDCDIYEVKNSGTKLWIWKWLALKSETIMGGVKINLTATKINENISVPLDKFAIPEKAALTIVDVDNIENKMREEKK